REGLAQCLVAPWQLLERSQQRRPVQRAPQRDGSAFVVGERRRQAADARRDPELLLRRRGLHATDAGRRDTLGGALEALLGDVLGSAVARFGLPHQLLQD